MSKKLIDPKLLLEDLGEEPYIWTDTDAEIQEHSDWLRFKKMIEQQPTVNAVEVVRCKDCKHYDEDTLTCHLIFNPSTTNAAWYPEDFCSYGKKDGW